MEASCVNFTNVFFPGPHFKNTSVFCILYNAGRYFFAACMAPTDSCLCTGYTETHSIPVCLHGLVCSACAFIHLPCLCLLDQVWRRTAQWHVSYQGHYLSHCMCLVFCLCGKDGEHTLRFLTALLHHHQLHLITKLLSLGNVSCFYLSGCQLLLSHNC